MIKTLIELPETFTIIHDGMLPLKAFARTLKDDDDPNDKPLHGVYLLYPDGTDNWIVDFPGTKNGLLGARSLAAMFNAFMGNEVKVTAPFGEVIMNRTALKASDVELIVVAKKFYFLFSGGVSYPITINHSEVTGPPNSFTAHSFIQNIIQLCKR